ncbi:fructokinase [Gellertiella hungarica]|uniref:Fructokinase n=2 Tax=Gellertiella hungarica TaxID=1572859 RepID=A0A7W6J364_9HYPH|nr:fructokinase [Gellertiella hungarica]
MLPRETTLGERAFAPYAGGAIFNTAIALGRLGIETGFFSGLSDDMLGDILRETLEKSGVDPRFAAISSRPTTIALVKLVNGQASYAFYDENTAGRMLDIDDLPSFGPEVNALHFGAISLIPEPCGTAYETLLMREADARVISLDPNIRPGFIRDADAHEARIRRMAAKSDIVKFSDEDLAWFGEEGDEETLARKWIARGAKLVLVTRGAEGATGYTVRHKVSVPVVKVEVVDTVGAGDTFDAGVLAALDRKGLLTKGAIGALTAPDIEDALTWGVKAAAVTVSRAGANPPTAAEIGF